MDEDMIEHRLISRQTPIAFSLSTPFRSQWVHSDTCESHWPPTGLKLSSFEKILVLQALRPDRLAYHLLAFAQAVMEVPSLSFSVNRSG